MKDPKGLYEYHVWSSFISNEDTQLVLYLRRVVCHPPNLILYLFQSSVYLNSSTPSVRVDH